MRHCLSCDRDYSDKCFRKHCHTNKHIKKRLGLDIYTKQKTQLLMKLITPFLI